MTDDREAFNKWFLESARAPIDPWHKEFAWAVWQAATKAANRPAVDEMEIRLIISKAMDDFAKDETNDLDDMSIDEAIAFRLRPYLAPSGEVVEDKPCPVCGGSGRNTEDEPDPIQAADCAACRGTGKL